jgi:hypothetical protein
VLFPRKKGITVNFSSINWSMRADLLTCKVSDCSLRMARLFRLRVISRRCRVMENPLFLPGFAAIAGKYPRDAAVFSVRWCGCFY